MLAVTGKSVSALFAEIAAQYGDPQWAEVDFRMTPARKAELQERLFVRCETPDFGAAVDHVSRLQGVFCRRQLGHLPLLRHGAAAAHGRRGRRSVRSAALYRRLAHLPGPVKHFLEKTFRMLQMQLIKSCVRVILTTVSERGDPHKTNQYNI